MVTFVRGDYNKRATAGEKRVATKLMGWLGDDDIMYFEPIINRQRPDLVLLLKHYGLVVVEVKDYTIDIIDSIDPHYWSIRSKANGLVDRRTAPERQAINYRTSLINILKKNPNLMAGNKLEIAYTYLVVLTNITALEAAERGLTNFLNAENVLYKNDLLDMDFREFSRFLEDSFPFRTTELTDSQIDNIRFSLFPEIRIQKEGSSIYNESNLDHFRDLKMMDLYQETLAKQLGDGHRLIKGVAGSGKTLILVAAAKLQSLANPKWKILIICYGVVMAQKLQSMISKDEFPNIKVWTFSQLLRHQYNSYSTDDVDSLLEYPFLDEMNQTYDSILVEEAQDFMASWFTLLSFNLSKETGSLLLVEDQAQNIYKRKVNLRKSTGLDFRGRSRTLKVNYRNTIEILRLARQFYQIVESELELEDQLYPIPAKRSGPEPILVSFKRPPDEVDYILNSIKEDIRNGIKPEDIVVLYRAKTFNGTPFVSILETRLKGNKIAHVWLTKTRESKTKFTKDEHVNVSTIDSAKGLDFRKVYLMQAGLLPFPLEEDRKREASLMYIALTRATEELVITYTTESEYTKILENLVGG